MGLFKNLFKKKHFDNKTPLEWDMHNHLLHCLDDGADSLETSLKMAELFVQNGYSKVFATPHILSDFYKNTPEIIRKQQGIIQAELELRNIPLALDIAAEYYLDEVFVEKVRNKEEILTFHDKHVLVETAFMSKPYLFEDALFEIQIAEFQPVLAHPERYQFFWNEPEQVEKLIEKGVKMQLNLLSLQGYYSRDAQNFAEWMIEHDYCHFLGSDAHNPRQMTYLQEVFRSKLFSKINLDKIENAKN
jgi:protein-tyrosine phosphatase